jgi:transcriptional regulator of acetoin/glycerol metabolism
MTAHPLSMSSMRYRPDQILQARRSYFAEGRLPSAGWVDQALVRSWQRCGELGLAVHEPLDYGPVGQAVLRRLLEEKRELLDAAQPAIDKLAQAVSGAGYAVLLTDATSRALIVAGHLESRSTLMRQAFRPGVDLCEATTGTTAMALALTEQHAACVMGAEHYFADNHFLHCYAVPVFDHRGHVSGAIDITRDTPGLSSSAMTLSLRCAQRIERRLFDRQAAFVRIALESDNALKDARLAFDHDGRWLAASRAACRLLDKPFVTDGMHFEDLFEQRFSNVVAALRRHPGRLALHLHGGVRLHASSPDAANAPTRQRGALLPPATAVSSAPMDTIFQASLTRARRAFDAGVPVLISGETGAGKEVAARALHKSSQRGDGPLIAINCGAIAPELVASELFGHVEGAYTGARRGGASGRIAAAQGGTVLLDEIGDMPLDLQVALLRVLDTGEVVPVGAAQAVAVDVRFICATHRDLPALVAAGRFREDLYHRLAGFILTVPPLRLREDFDAVLDTLCARIGCDPQRVGTALRMVLRTRRWPGNVRELQHALRLAVALAEDDEPLGVAHFTEPTSRPSAHSPFLEKPVDSLKDMQRRAIDVALQQTGGNVTAAAKLLGMGRATLYRKLVK